MKKNSLILAKNRSYRVRKKLRSVASEGRLRLSIFRSNKSIEAQIIDDVASRTLVAISSLQKALNLKAVSNIQSAEIVGKKIGEVALAKGIKKVYFDRGSYPYHGKIKSFCEAARASGLEF